MPTARQQRRRRQAPKQAARPHRVSITDQCLLVPQHLELEHELPFEEGEVVSYQLPGESEPAV